MTGTKSAQHHLDKGKCARTAFYRCAMIFKEQEEKR